MTEGEREFARLFLLQLRGREREGSLGLLVGGGREQADNILERITRV